jgi:uncharacterized repeat protein (TIGR04076 family)
VEVNVAERIVATVEKVYGKCKFWKKGDELVFIVDTHSRMVGLDMKQTSGGAACVIALSTIYPYVFTRKTWTSKMEYDYYRCPDPGPQFDGCGGVVFKVDRRPDRFSKEKASTQEK